MILAFAAAAALAGTPLACPLDALDAVQRPLAAERLGRLTADFPGGEGNEARLAAAAFERAVESCALKLGWTREKADAAMQYGTATLVLEAMKRRYLAKRVDLTRLDPVIDRLLAAPEVGGADAAAAMSGLLRAQGLTGPADEPEDVARVYAKLRFAMWRAEQDFGSAG